ncbi:glycosyltransferase family 2 protein [Methyloferula stellata]|uniref:glycosyltransferase family 2 protein n=1 Tax=Methyloferula stellata TaxID=876270 RepID=UPI001375B15F|nr:glycosyltransferase [Methyloferula stellata]
MADQGLPLPVSGSSNHFRTSVLREIHGWDAWNVTEDADIGLRLARFGYSVGVLDSTTYEEAPISLKAWFGQRRRWFKGWLQTFITVTRSPVTLVAELGVLRTAALTLLFLSLLAGPLFWIPSSLFVLIGVVSNRLWTPADFSGICLATLYASVTTLGTASLFWYALLGMKRQRLLYLWPALILLLPYYCLHAAAAWMALYELFRQPFHWHKTEHGLSRSTRRARAEPTGKKALA